MELLEGEATSPKALINSILEWRPAELEAACHARTAGQFRSASISSEGLQGLPRDKWILSSAVQKLIRRGQAKQAARAALALHRLDPEYLPRRLPIIAFEDIGFGDLVVCFDVLLVFGKQRFPTGTTETERRRLLVNLVQRLALATKSRAGCDIYCLAHVEKGVPKAVARFASRSEQCLVAMASDRGAPLTSRALALHLLSGMSVQEGRWTRPASRFNERALLAVADRLALPELLSWMVRVGRHTLGLAAMLPLVFELITASEPLFVAEQNLGRQGYSDRIIRGVPAYAMDMYTRTGKASIADLSRSIRERHPDLFNDTSGVATSAKLLGLALFCYEGSLLDRWLESAELTKLREQDEQAEFQVLGWPSDKPRDRLRQVIEAEANLLWRFRRSRMAAAPGPDLERG